MAGVWKLARIFNQDTKMRELHFEKEENASMHLSLAKKHLKEEIHVFVFIKSSL